MTKTTVYILEGSDCTGKSTLAQKLSEATGFKIVKGSSFEHSKCTNEELYKKFLELTKLDNVIIDRFIWSNLCYATLYSDYSILTDEQRKHIISLMKDKAELVWLTAPNEVIKQRLSIRGDDYINEEAVDSINELNNKVLSEVEGILTWEFDTSEIDTEGIVELLLA